MDDKQYSWETFGIRLSMLTGAFILLSVQWQDEMMGTLESK